MKTIEISGIEFATASEAIQWADASGEGRAVRLSGIIMVVAEAELNRLEALGGEFAYLFDYVRRDGKRIIVTVPVGD